MSAGTGARPALCNIQSKDRAASENRVMLRIVLIVINLISLAITLMCGIAAITISAAIVTGRFADPDAWMTAVFLAAVGGLSWLLCRATKDFTEPD